MEFAGVGVDSSSSSVAVIPEIYDNENTHRIALDRALEAGFSVIVIQPTQLGDETAWWISVGNFLHKSSVLTGLGSLITGIVWQDKPAVYTPLAIFSTLCTGLYTIFWQFDECVKYQVEKDPRKLAKLGAIGSALSTSSVVLVRKGDTRRKIIHCSASLLAASLCAFRLYPRT